jgi:hypothetical protein
VFDLKEEDDEDEDEDNDDDEDDDDDEEDDDDMHLDAKKGGLVGKSTLASRGPPERTEPT